MKHVFLALLCLMFGCSAATNQSEKPSPVPVTQLEVQDEIGGVRRIAKESETRNSVINWWVSAGQFLILLWILHELYKLNREIGERLARISSDSESEKATRARVNALILKQLGVKDASIEEVLRDVRKES